MNWKKTLLFISTALGTTTLAFHVINKFIFNTSDELSEEDSSNYYNWKFGNIYYQKTGSGSPLLLIHDLNHYSSSMEWDKVIDTLSREHTVYTIDLLGCGKSDKPAITYTISMSSFSLISFAISLEERQISLQPEHLFLL